MENEKQAKAKPYRPKKPLYMVLAQHIAWNPPPGEFREQRMREIKRCLEYMPSGSGWDLGTNVDLSRGDHNRIILVGEFHHMNGDGHYDGWTSHEIHVTPDLRYGFELRITGRDRNQVKDYLHEMFEWHLHQEIFEYERHEEEDRAEREQQMREGKPHRYHSNYETGLCVACLKPKSDPVHADAFTASAYEKCAVCGNPATHNEGGVKLVCDACCQNERSQKEEEAQ